MTARPGHVANFNMATTGCSVLQIDPAKPKTNTQRRVGQNDNRFDHLLEPMLAIISRTVFIDPIDQQGHIDGHYEKGAQRDQNDE